MSKYGPIYDGLEEAVSKVRLLEDSCKAIYENAPEKPGELWFDGAAKVLEEVADKINDALEHWPNQIETPTDQDRPENQGQ